MEQPNKFSYAIECVESGDHKPDTWRYVLYKETNLQEVVIDCFEIGSCDPKIYKSALKSFIKEIVKRLRNNKAEARSYSMSVDDFQKFCQLTNGRWA